MTSIYLKKIISFVLILGLVIGMSGLPQKAEAIGGVGDTVVEVGPNLFESIANAVSNAASAVSNYLLEYKAFVLDTLATAAAKAVIRQITADVVNWINSGFEGSPAFLTNPGSFFLDVADQVTGEFIARTGGPLSALCSPFSIDIRLALAFKYHPKIQQKYACTLGTIIANSRNAANNASINGRSIGGFLDGDFSQGGWPAFVSLTTEPQNNVYGAYLTAESELSLRVANAQLEKRDELSQGRGFLSWKKCTQYASDNVAAQGSTTYVDTESGDVVEGVGGTVGSDTENNDGSNRGRGKCIKEETQTPGSLIAGSLENSANGPLRELELVDSINQIVSALAAQLITQVLHGGLRSVSGSGPSDSSSYLQQVQAEAQTIQTGDILTTKNNFLISIEKYIKDALDFKNHKDRSLNLILDVKTTYDSAISCYNTKLTSSQPPLSVIDRARVEAKITEINTEVSREVGPLASKHLAEARSADERYNQLVGLQSQAQRATTLNDINTPLQRFSQMVQNRSLVGARDIIYAEQEVEDLRPRAAELKQDAVRTLQECQVFAPNTYTGPATVSTP